MNKNFNMLVVLCFSSFEMIGQVVGGVQGKGMDMQASAYGFVTQLPPAPPETKGDVYYNSEWTLADIKLYSQEAEVKSCPTKLNLQTNDLEININNEIKILSGKRVKTFAMKNNDGSEHRFINGKLHTFEAHPMNGFLMVIDSGTWNLYSFHEVKLVQAAYVAALDAGDKNPQLVKEKTYFVGKGNMLYRVYTSPKKFAAQFGDKNETVKAFLKENKINLKNQIDLITVVGFLDKSM